MQETHPDICNEDVNDVIYDTLGKIIQNCGSVMTSVEAAEVMANSSLFINNLDDLSTPCLKSHQGRETRSSRKEQVVQPDIPPSQQGFGRILKEFRSTHQGLTAG